LQQFFTSLTNKNIALYQELGFTGAALGVGQEFTFNHQPWLCLPPSLFVWFKVSNKQILCNFLPVIEVIKTEFLRAIVRRFGAL
jgi:hypothetical protein